tara:strand:- start:1361 stop:2308 length:948 start_codon:yes stop_codon:yes gene_type:complete
MVEYRKLIKFGESSYVISLPSKWIKKNKLKKGNLIYVDERSQSELVLSLGKSSEIEEKEEIIDIDSYDLESLKRKITSSYVRGVTNLILRGNNLAEISIELKELLHNLIGLEIMEQTTSRIVAKDLLSIENISISNMIRKITIITESMIEDSKTITNEPRHSLHLYSRDEDVNRLSYLILRIIKMGFKSPVVARNLEMDGEQLFQHWELVENLESVADEAKRISRSITKLNIKKLKTTKFIEIYEEIESIYKKVIQYYYKGDKDGAFKVSSLKKVIVKKCDSLLVEYNHPEIVRLVERLKTMMVSIRNLSRLVYQ